MLERVSPRLAEAITDLPEAAPALRRLASVASSSRNWPPTNQTYRYHNLLRDFLAVELEAREPGVDERACTAVLRSWFHAAG